MWAAWGCWWSLMVMIYDGMMINDVWRLMMVRQWGIRGEEEEESLRGEEDGRGWCWFYAWRRRIGGLRFYGCCMERKRRDGWGFEPDGCCCAWGGKERRWLRLICEEEEEVRLCVEWEKMKADEDGSCWCSVNRRRMGLDYIVRGDEMMKVKRELVL